jgi:WS/DGAT/MGAT family acyltransferase
MTSNPMRAADAAWLHMDRPTNPMVVNGLILLGGVPDPDLTTELLERRLIDRFPRFSQRVTERLGRSPAFEDDPSFDLDNHLHRLALPAPGGPDELRAMLSDLVTPPLDPGKPLWHAYLIEGGEGGAAILWRIHHCIADGIALARVLLSTTDDGGTPGELGPPPDGGRSLLRRLVDLPRDAIGVARDAGGAIVHEGIESLAHPDHLRTLADTALRDVATTAKLVGSPADPQSDLRVPLTGARRVAWSEPFPLARVREAARRRQVTINDLLVTALAGSLHDLLGSDGRLPEEVHAMVPFNLRPLDEPVPEDLGNDFALVLLSLPVGEVTTAERLREVNSRMDAIKNSHEAPISYGIISAIGLTPPWVEDPLIGFFTEKASLVVTNVPGPRKQLRFGGVPIDGVLVWAPCSGTLGLTVSIFSYKGEVTVGFMADTGLIDDPEPLAGAYERQLEELCGHPEPSTQAAAPPPK